MKCKIKNVMFNIFTVYSETIQECVFPPTESSQEKKANGLSQFDKTIGFLVPEQADEVCRFVLDVTRF